MRRKIFKANEAFHYILEYIHFNIKCLSKYNKQLIVYILNVRVYIAINI